MDDSKSKSSARNLELLWPKLSTDPHDIITATEKPKIRFDLM